MPNRRPFHPEDPQDADTVAVCDSAVRAALDSIAKSIGVDAADPVSRGAAYDYVHDELFEATRLGLMDYLDALAAKALEQQVALPSFGLVDDSQ